MTTVEQYWKQNEWSKGHQLELDNCPIESNVGGDCKELIDSTDFIIQSTACHGGDIAFQKLLIKEVILIMEIWYFG